MTVVFGVVTVVFTKGRVVWSQPSSRYLGLLWRNGVGSLLVGDANVVFTEEGVVFCLHGCSVSCSCDTVVYGCMCWHRVSADLW